MQEKELLWTCSCGTTTQLFGVAGAFQKGARQFQIRQQT